MAAFNYCKGLKICSEHVRLCLQLGLMHVTVNAVADHSPPLSGVRILDLTRVLAGPFATQQLADLGADVIKIERPERGDDTRGFGPPFIDGESTYFMSINRGKRSVVLDFKSERGRSILEQLIVRSDVLIENFRPGVLERLGFSWQTMQKLNPKLIYASISGFGHDGLPEFTQAPGYDLMIQSLAGVASLTGDPDSPPSKAGISIGDLVGGLYAVQGILAALYDRHNTGRGRRVDIAMFDGLVSLLTYHAGNYLGTGNVPQRMGNRHPSICPFETLKCADDYIAVCCGNDAQFIRLTEALELPQLATDVRFDTNAHRVEHRDQLIPIIQDALAREPAKYWLERLKQPEFDVPCAAIETLNKVLTHPQLHARGLLEVVQHPRLGALEAVGSPVRIDGNPSFNMRPPPELGEHTLEVILELELDQ